MAGADLGFSRGASAVVMLAVDVQTQQVWLAKTRRWLPARGQRVDLLEVAGWIDQLDRTFCLSRVSSTSNRRRR